MTFGYQSRYGQLVIDFCFILLSFIESVRREMRDTVEVLNERIVALEEEVALLQGELAAKRGQRKLRLPPSVSVSLSCYQDE